MRRETDLGAADFILPCRDLDAALEYFTGPLEFRLETIFPADDPRVVVVSGHGKRLRLERTDAPARGAGTEWHTGRAGMQYRDLIPGREGGRLVASHIRIRSGGPVPDYVHFHEVRFQMIYCRRGEVRVVYEDQGAPFVLRPGDCVLQPTGIRHRVLDCSPGLEVIEISSPAEHATHADHEMELPTAVVRRDRDFDGQRFLRHVAADATWEAGVVEGFACRDTGIARATGGLGSARVLRPAGDGAGLTLRNEGDRLVLFVLEGGADELAAGDCRVIRDSLGLTNPSADLRLLAVTMMDAVRQ